METEEIRLELFKRRKVMNMNSLAKSLGVTRQCIYNTVNRRFRSRRVAEAVAAAIERPLEDVFPEYLECPDRRRAACR